MSSADPERQGDGFVPEHVIPLPQGREYGYPGRGGDHAAARRDLAAELESGLPCRADRETMLAALRDIARLAGRWKLGVNDVGPAAAAEVMDAIRGEHTEPRWSGPSPAPPWYGQATPGEQCGAPGG